MHLCLSRIRNPIFIYIFPSTLSQSNIQWKLPINIPFLLSHYSNNAYSERILQCDVWLANGKLVCCFFSRSIPTFGHPHLNFVRIKNMRYQQIRMQSRETLLIQTFFEQSCKCPILPMLLYQCTLDSDMWKGVECKMWNVKKVECWVAMSRVKCQVGIVECGVQSVKFGVKSIKWRV